jgi:hypothetical protein
MELGIKLTEATEGFIIGSILPVAAALLQRRVWVEWIGESLFTNLFNLLVGPAGDGKSSLINLSDALAKACLDDNARFSPVLMSPQGLFEQYYEPNGGNPDKFCVAHEGNRVITDWTNTTIGECVAATFLDLFDCKGLEETYIRNKKDNEGNATRRIEQTSTSTLFGGTFNVSNFQGTLVRQGMDRRFLKYVSTGPGRTVIWPGVKDTSALHDSFSKLREMRGIMSLAQESESLWEKYQHENRKLMSEADPWDDALIARIRSCPAAVLKI